MEHPSSSMKVLRLFPWAVLFAECPHGKQATRWTCKMDEGDSSPSLLDASTSSLPLHQCLSFLPELWDPFCCCLVIQSCLTLCDPMDCSMPGFPVHHKLPELAQTHVHWVSDAIQTSHLLSSPSPVFNLSQHQGLFQWVSSLHQWPKYWRFSFSISPSNEYSNWLPLGLTGFISLLFKGPSRVFSSTTVKKHLSFSA